MKSGRNTNDEDITNEVFMLRPYTHKELAQLYKVSWLTFQRWLKDKEQEIGKKHGHFYHINQVLKIFKIFGIPKRFKVSIQEVEEMFRES
jgi:transposase